MRGALPREKNRNWKGGRVIASNGYVLIKVGIKHHLADVRGYAYEHRLVAEKKLGRRLRKGEQIHHLDGNKENNAPANLQVLTPKSHMFLHRNKNSKQRKPDQLNRFVLCACGCGRKFLRFDSQGRSRRFVTGHNHASKKTLLERKRKNASHKN